MTFPRPHRRLEWWLAICKGTYGLWLMLIPSALTTPQFSAMLAAAPPHVWGLAALLLSLFQIWALVINGCLSWSPYVRAVATGITAVFFSIILGLLSEPVYQGLATPTLVIPMHAAFIVAAVMSFWVASKDACYAFHHRKAAE